MKKSLLSLLFVVSGLSGMNQTIDFQRLPKRELVILLQQRRKNPSIETINDVPETNIFVQEEVIESTRPSFISRNRNKIIGLGAVAALTAAGISQIRSNETIDQEDIVEDEIPTEVIDQEEEIVYVQEEIVENKRPSFFSRHKRKLIGLGVLATIAATGYGSYHYFPGFYNDMYDHAKTAVGMIKTLVQSRFIPKNDVEICKTIRNTGFFNRLFNGNSYETCTKVNNMSFKEIFNSFFR